MIRYYNKIRARHPSSPISLDFFDMGHPRGQGDPAAAADRSAQAAAWMDYYLKGVGPRPRIGVETWTQSCPKGHAGGPFLAADWAGVAAGEVRYRSPAPLTISPTAGDPALSALFDPQTGGGACATAPGADQPGTATFRLLPAPADGYTLMGSPTVIADFAVRDRNSQIAARLLDVGTDGRETLIARGLWRPAIGWARQVFQLHPNGWRFEPGHVPKLELLPNDAPYGRASNTPQPVTVSRLDLRLPVLERPGSDGGTVKTPAPKVLPAGYRLAPNFTHGIPLPRVTGGEGSSRSRLRRLADGLPCETRLREARVSALTAFRRRRGTAPLGTRAVPFGSGSGVGLSSDRSEL